jgi:hypothetical protein
MEMSTPPPQSPAVKQLSFEMGAMRDMIEGLLETKFEKFTDLFQQVLEARNEANSAKKEAAEAKAETAAAMARVVKAEADAHAAKLEAAQAMAEAERLRAKCTVSFEGVFQRLTAVEGAMNSQSATIIEKSVAELKASPSWANIVRGGPTHGSPSQQQRNTQPAVEQQFIMVGLEDVEGKNQLEVASMVKETLCNIGVPVSELHDVLLLKPRPGAAVGAPRRIKFTVMTAMQARLIRANRKQLREVAAHISIRDVLSPEEQAAQNFLWPQFLRERKAGKRAYFQRGQLFVDGCAVEARASA